MAWSDFPAGMTPAEQTMQDRAEAFWRKRLPGLSDDLVTRLAFSFGCEPDAISTQHRQELCEAALDYLYANAIAGPDMTGWVLDDGQTISVGLDRSGFSFTSRVFVRCATALSVISAS